MKLTVGLFLVQFFFISCAQNKTLKVGFYSNRAPISASKSLDAEDWKFNEPVGYEADILKAVQSMPNSQFEFEFVGIESDENIWLRSKDEFDLVCGGIVIDKEKEIDAENNRVVQFTEGHLHLRQSLLVKKKNRKKFNSLKSFDAKNSIGVVAKSRSERKLLEELGYLNKNGELVAGVTLTNKGNKKLTIKKPIKLTHKKFRNRVQLSWPDNNLPIIKFGQNEDDLSTEVINKKVDAFVWNEVENSRLEKKSKNALKISGVFPKEINSLQVDRVGCTVNSDNEELLNEINTAIKKVTGYGTANFEIWRKNPNIFVENASKL
jgi:ABC-type amino acid transport substrate-binding protein